MFLDELNPQQLKAVSHFDGPTLVVAGAGSGKTRVITSRIIYGIQEKNVSPESILAITFTNKAAKEMKQRVYDKLNFLETLPWISTFHSFCLALLRKHIHELGFTNDFVIYDAQDQLSLVKKCMKTAQVNEEAFPPKSILNCISGFKNDYLLPEDIDIDAMSYSHRMKAAYVYPFYQQTLRSNNALDFDDLLMLSVKLFREKPQVCDYYNNKYQYILVDEFQDTNLTQYHLVRLLSRNHQNVCVVGDDDQSIYSWRGANIENILNFEKDYPNTCVVKLEQNYRSTQNILQAAGAVVRENEFRKDKTLWTENEKGPLIKYYRAQDEVDEARRVCDCAQEWVAEGGWSYDDVSILYRTNAQSRVLEDQLRQAGVPYKVIGGLRFYERKEIKDILSYMRIVINPVDSVSLKRIINLPTRGIGKTTVEKVEAFSDSHNISLLEAFRQAGNEGIVKSGAVAKIAHFLNIWDHLHRVYEEESPVDFVREVIELSGYGNMLEKENTVESRSRLENLNELYTAVEQFVETEQKGNLQDFLDTAALVSDQDSIDDSQGILHLMTLHTCKGLEFEGVFIIGAENGLLPHASSLSNNEEYEEERRLCYVGITRAKQRLMISNARRRHIYGNTYNYQPSDFLSSIPGEILQKENSYETVAPSVNRYRESNTLSIPESADPSYEQGEYVVGTKVLHPKFGSGVVVNREGREENLKLVVFFKGVGKKKLAVNQANLIVV